MTTKTPRCCGKRMQVSLETAHYIELWCDTCDDMVYMKKDEVNGPQLIDD